MTKVAILSRSSPDYLVDIVADGMIRLLGRENIHLAYLFPTIKPDTVSQLFDGFEVQNRFPMHEADCLVSAIRGTGNIVQDWMKKTGKKTTAILDGEDSDPVQEDFARIVGVYFKREYMRGRTYLKNIMPLPFAAIPEALPPASARAGAFFMGLHRRDPMRAAIAAVMTHMGIPVTQSQIPKESYNRRLAASLVGVSVRGAGWDTYRYWEVPYFGAALLSQRLPIEIPADFVDGQEAVFFQGPEDFREKLQALLDHPEEARRIAQAGQRACLERHLSIHRARTVLETVL